MALGSESGTAKKKALSAFLLGSGLKAELLSWSWVSAVHSEPQPGALAPFPADTHTLPQLTPATHSRSCLCRNSPPQESTASGYFSRSKGSRKPVTWT